MNKENIIKLIRSLSAGEKRQFSLSTKKQAHDRAFIFLFELIESSESTDWSYIKETFLKKYPKSSAESCLSYLYQTVTDVLIQNKIQNDNLFDLVNSYMKITLFKQRNLHELAMGELKKISPLIDSTSKLPLKYLLQREKLDMISESGFENMDEKKLISEQQVAREILNDMRSIQEFYSLFEILKFRLSFLSEKDMTSLGSSINDLVLNEVAIMNNKTRNTLETRKVHLLFQSFYFNHIGQHQSALRTFFALNNLLENELDQLPIPPLEYYSVLDGILDSLSNMGYHEEISYFIRKLEFLNNPKYPDYFNLMVNKTIILYSIKREAILQKWEDAIQLISTAHKLIISNISLLSEKRHADLIFYSSLAYFHKKNYQKASKYLNINVLNKQTDFSQLHHRASRLLNLVLCYELKDFEYLEYEIRSYKRFFNARDGVLPLENLLFMVMSNGSIKSSNRNNHKVSSKFENLKNSAGQSRTEKDLLAYFDFMEWASHKIKNKIYNN